MIEIESSKAYNLYDIIKYIILSKKHNKSFNYKFKQHYLYEEAECQGISKGFYNECGKIEFENINGEIIGLKFERWHPHQHNGWSGLNSIPCLNAKIYIIKDKEEKVLWELRVKSGTMYFKAEVSSLEIPYDFLQEKQLLRLPVNSNIPKMLVMKDEIQLQKSKLQETRILFDEIVNLHNKYKRAKQTGEDLLLKREKKIQLVAVKIIQSYAPKITKNNEDIIVAKKELNDFDGLFVKYSTFNIDLIGSAIQQLISMIENEEYSYAKVTHKYKEVIHGIMDSWDEEVETKVKIIVRKDKLENCYISSYKSESKIDELVKKGYAILLYENRYNSKNIVFYTSKDGDVSSHIDFGKFNYIKEFMDSLVQYRFQNDIVEMTEKEMLSFMKNFIIEHEDIILGNYGSRIKEKALSLQLDIP